MLLILKFLLKYDNRIKKKHSYIILNNTLLVTNTYLFLYHVGQRRDLIK